MENWIMIATGILLLVFGYLIGLRHKINIVHSYHYKRVCEEDKPKFCRGVGLGNIIIGVGLIIFPITKLIFTQQIASWVMGVVIVVGGLVTFSTIIKFNKWLF